jgi:hypothetical protein
MWTCPRGNKLSGLPGSSPPHTLPMELAKFNLEEVENKKDSGAREEHGKISGNLKCVAFIKRIFSTVDRNTYIQIYKYV